MPAGKCYHCHTGRCPVGITTQDPELRKRLVVDEAAERVYNFLHTLTLEVQLLARACGKTNVHSLEPEDLAALTVEAAAMAKVPLAGTDYIPGVTEERALERDRARCSSATSTTRSTSSPSSGDRRRRRRRQRGGARMSAASPRSIALDRRRVPRRASASPTRRTSALVEDVDLLAATPGEDINWLEDIHLLEEEGVPAVFDRYSNSFLKIYFADPARGARTRSPARC